MKRFPVLGTTAGIVAVVLGAACAQQYFVRGPQLRPSIPASQTLDDYLKRYPFQKEILEGRIERCTAIMTGMRRSTLVSLVSTGIEKKEAGLLHPKRACSQLARDKMRQDYGLSR